MSGTWPRRSLPALGLAVAAPRIARAQALEPLSFIMSLGVAAAEVPILLGLHQGWYREAGLDLEVRVGRGSAYAVQLTGAGQVDIGEGSLTTMATAVQRGVPVVSIFAGTRRSDMAMLVDRDSPAAGPGDMRGKRLLCFATSPWVPFIDAYLRRGGLRRSDVTVVMVDPNAMFTTWASRSVDAFLTVPSYSLPIVERTRPARPLHTYEVGLPTLGTGFVVTRETAERRGRALTAFLAVTQRAIAYTEAGHEDEAIAAAIAQKPNERIDPAVIKAQLLSRRPYITSDATAGHPLGWQAEADWKAAIDAMEEVTLLRPGSKPTDYYTNAFIAASPA